MSGDSPGTSRVSLGDLTEYDTLILPTGDSPSPARSEPPPPPLTSQDVSAAAAATMLAFAEMPYSATGQSLHEAGTAGTLAGVKRPNPEPDSGAGAWTPRSPTAPAPDPGGPAAASSAGGLPSGAGGTGLGSAALEHSGTAGSVESGEQGGRKARLVWTQELHNRFINALSHLVRLPGGWGMGRGLGRGWGKGVGRRRCRRGHPWSRPGCCPRSGMQGTGGLAWDPVVGWPCEITRALAPHHLPSPPISCRTRV